MSHPRKLSSNPPSASLDTRRRRWIPALLTLLALLLAGPAAATIGAAKSAESSGRTVSFDIVLEKL